MSAAKIEERWNAVKGKCSKHLAHAFDMTLTSHKDEITGKSWWEFVVLGCWSLFCVMVFGFGWPVANTGNS